MEPSRQILLVRALDYIKIIARHMRLSDWDIRLAEQPSEPGAHADITCIDGRKVAVIRLSEEFFDCPEESKRHTIVHELIHVHLWSTLNAPHSLSKIVGNTAFRIFMDNFNSSVEYAVDGLADAIAPHLPLMADIDA